MSHTRQRRRHAAIIGTAKALGIRWRHRPIEEVYREVNRLKERTVQRAERSA